jgi:chromosome segregation protein
LSRQRYLELTGRKTEIALEIKSLGDQRLGFDAGLDGQYAEVEAARTALAERDHTLALIGTQIMELSDRAHQLETTISVNRERRENLGRTVTQNREEIDALTKRAAAIREESERAAADSARLGAELEKASQRLEAARTQQQRADAAYLEFRTQAETETARLVELQGKISSGRTDSANVEEQIRELHGEIERHTERKAVLIEEKRRRRQEITSLQEEIEAARRTLREQEEALVTRDRELGDTMGEADRLRDRLSEAASGYEATLARKNLLMEMIEHYEGFGSGVVAVFDVAARWTDITGTVADILRPHEPFQTALEAALGETAQYILAETQSSARDAVAYLREKRAGRATFLVLERLSAAEAELVPPDIPGIIGRADTLVACDERYRRVPSALLGRTIVCEQADAAMAALAVLPTDCRAVTLAGEMFSRGGILSGGASEDISLIGRKNEVETLTTRLSEMDQQMAQMRHRQAELTLTIAEIRQATARSTQQIADDRDRVAELVSRLKEQQFKINAADEITTNIEQQTDQLGRRLEKLKHRQYALTLDFDELDREKAGVSRQVDSKRSRLNELEQAAQLADDLVGRLQITRIEQEGKRQSLDSQIAYFGEMLADIAANTEAKEQQSAQAAAEAVELAAHMDRDERSLRELFDRRTAEEAAGQEVHRQRDDLAGRIGEIEEQAKKLRREREQVSDRIHQAEIAMAELGSRLEQVIEHARVELE